MRHLPVLRLVAAACALAALPVHAHRTWLVPSATLVDGPAAIVSVDAAVSEDLFEFDTTALQLDDLVVTAPDGTSVPVDARSAARRRTTFDVKLAQKGTFRLAGVTDSAMASWKAGGETKRSRGTLATLAREIPADAQELQVTRMLSRVETFVSYQAPGPVPASPGGAGLELQPLDSPTDLSVGDTTRFRLLLDGKPLAATGVTLIRGGNRYRYKLGEVALRTDADGAFAVTWPEGGRWWLGASHGGRGPGATGPAGTLAAPARRESYSATFEVLPR